MTSNAADASLLLTPKASTSSQQRETKTTPSTNSEMEDLKQHIDKSIDKVLTALQAESNRRSALEQRLHSQLLLQSEGMIAMELKLLKLEAKVDGREQQSRSQQQQNGSSNRRGLASSSTLRTRQSGNNEGGVVSTSLLLDDDGEQDVSIDGSDSTPTFGSRPHFGGGTLESILNKFGEGSFHGESTRATRGDDGNSSLATSITGSTLTTRGGDSSIVRLLPEAIQYSSARSSASRGASMELYGRQQQPRSRSQSPLTVQSRSTVASETTDNVVMGSGSILTTGAVAAPKRRFGDSNPRVVSFTANVLPPHNVLANGDGGAGAGDSITMPDELADNLSEVADTFGSSARLWREEYEARLDALQKKFAEN